MSNLLYNEAHLDEYIDLIIKRGVNIQPGQQLMINSSVDCAFFTRRAAKAAFDAGASNVHIRWHDDVCSRIRYLMADAGVFDEFPQWDKLMYDSLSDAGAAVLSISSSDPEVYKGVDSDRLSRFNIALSAALKDYYDKIMSNGVRWCVASVPSEAWAQKVFPKAGSCDDAVRLLWESIFAATRVGCGDTDGSTAADRWLTHVGKLKQRVATLNKYRFKSLHFKNNAGTDITIELPANHIWQGGGDVAQDGHAFLPNIPTEEIFTAPLAAGVNGTVSGSMPNIFRGNIIDDFSITFKDGKVSSFDAKTGCEHLEKLITDIPGMDSLGEIALVEHDSPISNTGILFYNTLYDENASCHLALGSAYPDCVDGGAGMSKDERRECGINVCDNHHDFMFGTEDMSIDGVTEDGKDIAVFRNGSFVI